MLIPKGPSSLEYMLSGLKILNVTLPELFSSGESIVISPSQSRDVNFEDCSLIFDFNSPGDNNKADDWVFSNSLLLVEEQE